MKFSEGSKSFEMCTNCSSKPASPSHILECLGLTKQDLADDPLLVLDFLRLYEVMDLVYYLWPMRACNNMWSNLKTAFQERSRRCSEDEKHTLSL
ncbi:RNase H domain-containing protein [Trichonephila clavipes]|nr:RNase H domain-containing protein [Trichonephila clavipes]